MTNCVTMQEVNEITLPDFAGSVGTDVHDIPADCRELLEAFDSRYRRFTAEERDGVILEVIKRIESPRLSVSGTANKVSWEMGWRENLENFVNKNFDVEELVPKYVKPNSSIRLYNDYVMPYDPLFERHWCEIFRRWLFKKYFSEVDAIYDFGCGTGMNLIELAKIFPRKKLYGLDWAQPSVDIIDLLAKKFGYNVEGRLFDFFDPDYSVEIPQNSGILAFGALEQIGSNFESFMQFVLNKSPSIFVLVNAIVELYDEDKLADHLAIRFNNVRNYLTGFLPYIRRLEQEKKVEVIKVQKVPFGTQYIDGFSFIVLKPLVT